MKRRDFLRGCVGAASGAAATAWLPSLAQAADFPKPVPEAEGLTAYQKDGCIQVRLDNLRAIGYRAQPSLKYPYFYPLAGPLSGLSLTTESALPYPHHRGLWLGCDPLNGGNYWGDNGLKSGHIRTVALELDDVAADGAVTFSQECVWEREGSNPFNDQRRYLVEILDARRTLIDCSFLLHAGEDVSIKGAKHSFFAMRAAPDIAPPYGGTLINSAGGIGARETYGKTAKWCGFFGKRRFHPEVTEGIVIMNHPANFGGNCPWFTRDYGHLSPSPFNFLDQPWTMEKGEPLQLNYRVVLFGGTPKEAGLDAIFDQWLG